MAFTKNINTLIADPATGIARKDFLATTQIEWANAHMVLRYNAAPPTEHDEPDSFVHRCYRHLLGEYTHLRAWFTEPDFKLSLLLQSKFLSSQFSGPMEDGFGWDFGRDGDPEPRMIQFKSLLISCQRQIQMIPRCQRDHGNGAISGIARIVRGAFASRAETNMWRGIERRKDGKVEVVLSGEELAKRWVAFRTMAFLVGAGFDAWWAWSISGCHKVLGPVDEMPDAGDG